MTSQSEINETKRKSESLLFNYISTKFFTSLLTRLILLQNLKKNEELSTSESLLHVFFCMKVVYRKVVLDCLKC